MPRARRLQSAALSCCRRRRVLWPVPARMLSGDAGHAAPQPGGLPLWQGAGGLGHWEHGCCAGLLLRPPRCCCRATAICSGGRRRVAAPCWAAPCWASCPRLLFLLPPTGEAAGRGARAASRRGRQQPALRQPLLPQRPEPPGRARHLCGRQGHSRWAAPPGYILSMLAFLAVRRVRCQVPACLPACCCAGRKKPASLPWQRQPAGSGGAGDATAADAGADPGGTAEDRNFAFSSYLVGCCCCCALIDLPCLPARPSCLPALDALHAAVAAVLLDQRGHLEPQPLLPTVGRAALIQASPMMCRPTVGRAACGATACAPSKQRCCPARSTWCCRMCGTRRRRCRGGCGMAARQWWSSGRSTSAQRRTPLGESGVGGSDTRRAELFTARVYPFSTRSRRSLQLAFKSQITPSAV